MTYLFMFLIAVCVDVLHVILCKLYFYMVYVAVYVQVSGKNVRLVVVVVMLIRD